MDNKEIALELTKIIRDEIGMAIQAKAQNEKVSASDIILETYVKILAGLDENDLKRQKSK